MRTQHRKRVKHFSEPGSVHELTFSCYQRRQLLTNDLWRQMFCEAIDRAIDRHGFLLYAFVVMPEHVHLIVQQQSTSDVSRLLRAIERPFSYRIKKLLEAKRSRLLETLTIRQRPEVTTFRFWQEGPGYDRNLTEANTIVAAVDYVHENPVRRRLCSRAIDWKWSSASFYVSDGLKQMPGLPKLTRLSPDMLQ